MHSLRRAPWLPHAAAIAIILTFLLINARGLGTTPVINEDEAWIAAPGVHFFETGDFATPVFTGYYASEQHYYDFMPLYSLLDGAALKLLAPIGNSTNADASNLTRVRVVSLSLAAITLWLTFLLGRRLLSPWHGVVAAWILACWPIAGTGIKPYLSLSTGIPLTDLGRIGRYDILVPVLCLSSLLVLLHALDHPRIERAGLLLSGALTGLAALAHYYGAVWLFIVIAVVLTMRGRDGLRQIAWPAVGFAIALLPWMAFVMKDLPTFLAQKQAQSGRYGFDASTISAEWDRYRLILLGLEQAHIATIAWITALVVGGVLLARVAWLRRGDPLLARIVPGARVLVVSIVVLKLAFALLVRRRLFNYLGVAWPLFAIAASFALLYPWKAAWRRTGHVVFALVVIATTVEGGVAYARMWQRAANTTPYADVCARIATHLPPDAKLLALQHWWLGLKGHVTDYRSFIVPITKMNPLETTHPISFVDAMAVDPMTHILIDPEMADIIRAAGNPARPKASRFGAEIRDFLKASAIEVDAFDDASYGRFTLYRVTAPARP